MPLMDSIGDRSFTPQQLEAIRTAFEALRDLGLRNHDDPLVQIVAKAVIEIASAGQSDRQNSDLDPGRFAR